MKSITKGVLICYCTLGFLDLYSQTNDCNHINKERNNQCLEEKIRNDYTNFPENHFLDYEFNSQQVKICVPKSENQIRFWVKSDSTKPSVSVYSFNGEQLIDNVKLKKPFYTQVFELNESQDSLRIEFKGESDDIVTRKVFPKTTSFYEKDESFSIIFYGCFQPFTVESQKSTILHDDKNPFNYYFRQGFQNIANSKKLNYSPRNEKERVGIILKNPKLIIGTGDQFYSDAGYLESSLKNHPLSAWGHTCNNPYPLLDSASFEKHLHNGYTSFYSFSNFRNVFSRLPSINVWDDHEIRDGWGSHGDEYINGKLNDSLKPYYLLARKAFVEHQLATGPIKISDNLIEENKSLHQELKIKNVQIFAFDLRSNRNICENRVISDSQMKDFKKWSKSVKENSEVLIISSMPLFYKSNLVAEGLAKKLVDRGELRDDFNDSWFSEPNVEQRNQIIAELIKMRNRDIKPIIISGDAHVGAMMSIWFKKSGENSKDNKRLAYEFIFSGLSHEKLGENRNAFQANLQKRSELIRVKDPTQTLENFDVYPIYEFTRAKLNFGGIQFENGKKTVVSLFINGDNEKNIIQRYLSLDWTENYNEYLSKTNKPWHWYINPLKWGKFRPQDVPYNYVSFTNFKE